MTHTHPHAGSNKTRQEIGKPGHCDDCAEHGHVVTHPDLGCGDVGCDKHHPATRPPINLDAIAARQRERLGTPACPPWCASGHEHDDYFRIHHSEGAEIDQHPRPSVYIGLGRVDEPRLAGKTVVLARLATGHEAVHLPPHEAVAMADILDAIETDFPTPYVDLAEHLRAQAALAATTGGRLRRPRKDDE